MFPLSATSNSLLDCWSYAGVGKRTLFIQSEFFPTPFLLLIARGCKSTDIAMSDSVGIATDLVVGVSFNGMNDPI